MLKRTLCQVLFTWELSCSGPLLIRDERFQNCEPGKQDSGYPQCLFISHQTIEELKRAVKKCAHNPPKNLSFYVPGTSIRGPFRAHAERIVRTLCQETALPPYTACEPFQDEEEPGRLLSCSKRLDSTQSQKGETPYGRACPACRIFGCGGLASRIQFEDADIKEGYQSVYRDMIGIDRFTGGVSSGANIKLHVLENTRFVTRVALTNFELWHLGLLAYVFQDFKDSLVPIGFGKTKGFGMVAGKVTGISLKFCKAPRGIEHLGSLMSNENERNSYGIIREEPLEFNGFDMPGDSIGLSWHHQRSITNKGNIASFLQNVKAYFNRFISNLSVEEGA